MGLFDFLKKELDFNLEEYKEKKRLKNINLIKSTVVNLRRTKQEYEFLEFYEKYENILYVNYNNLRYYVMIQLDRGEVDYLGKYFKEISTRDFKKGERSRVYSLFKYIKDDRVVRDILEKVLEIQPNNIDAYKELVNMSILAGHFKEAIDYLEEALKYNNDSEVVETSLLLLKNKVGANKSYIFLENLKDKFSKKDFIYLKAYFSIIHRNYKDVIGELSLLIDLDNKIAYKNSLVRILNPCLQEERFDDYNKYLELYIELNPNAKDIDVLKYKYYYHLKDWGNTVKYAKSALIKTKQINQAFDSKIKALIQLEKYDEVKKTLFELDLEYRVSEHILLYLKGVYKYNLLEYSEATEYFKKAIEVKNNNYPESLRWLLKSYKQNQMQENAENCFWKYEKQYIDRDILILNLADSASLLSYIEKKYSLYMQSPIDKNELSEWFIKYLLRHRYWGRAYTLVKKIEELYGLSNFLFKTKQILEKNFSEVEIDINKEYVNGKRIEPYKSSELVISKILDKINKTRKQCKNKKIKRVALVLTSLGPGGAERQCVNVFNGLIEKVRKGEIEDVRLFVTSLTHSDRESFYLKDIVDQTKVIEYYDRTQIMEANSIKSLKPFENLINLMQPITRQQTLISLTKHLEEFNPTVIHGWQNEAVLNSFIVGGILNTCSLVGRWGSLPPTISRNLTEVQSRNVDYIHYAYKEMGKKLKHKIFTANSNIAAEAYSKWIDYRPIKTIYNGLNVEDLKVTINSDEMKKKLGLDKDSLIVGSIYRISDEKRPFLWVDIAEKVNNLYNQKVHFILVGDGLLKEQVEKYINKKNIQDFVHLVGRQDDVANWYNIMNIFLLTSAVEGISNSMLEAEYMGVPVVVPDVGGLKEAIIEKKSGFLIEDATLNNFSKIIIDILNSKWDEKDKNFAKKYIEEKFSISKMVENTFNFYKENIDG